MEGERDIWAATGRRPCWWSYILGQKGKTLPWVSAAGHGRCSLSLSPSADPVWLCDSGPKPALLQGHLGQRVQMLNYIYIPNITLPATILECSVWLPGHYSVVARRVSIMKYLKWFWYIYIYIYLYIYIYIYICVCVFVCRISSRTPQSNE